MKNIAVIPIRSSSTRLSGKNFINILGTPLYGIAAKIAKESNVFDDVIVAIDRPKLISDYCEDNNFKIFKRSKKSADSKAQTEDVFKEIIESKQFDSEWLTLIQATCPFQNIKYFNALNEKIDENKYNSIITRTKFKRFFVKDVTSKGFNRNRTQDIEPSYLETGLFWSFKSDNFIESMNRIISPVGYVDIDNGDDLDIDTEEDLNIVFPRLKNEILKKRNNYIKRNISQKDIDYFDPKIDPDGKSRDFLNEVQGRLNFAENEIAEIKNYIHLNNFSKQKKAAILDIGCGTGVISGEFIKEGADVTGIEPSEAACEHAKDRITQVFCGGYEEHTNRFSDNSFDVIIAFHVIEHVPNPNNLLDEIARMLKRGGMAVISTPDFEGPVAKKYGKKFRLYNDPTHISLFGMTGLIKSIESRSLSVNKIDQPFLETKFFTKENILRLFSDEEVSPPFTGNVISLYVTK